MRNSKRDLIDEGWNLMLLSPRLCPAEGPTSADPAQNLASFIPVRSITILLLCDKPEILASPNSRMQFPTTEYVLQIPPHFLSERHVCLRLHNYVHRVDPPRLSPGGEYASWPPCLWYCALSNSSSTLLSGI